VWQTQCAALGANCNNTVYPCAPRPGGQCGVDVEHLTNLRLILNVLCVKALDSAGVEKFCVPSFYTFVKDKSPLSAARLDAGCDLCTLKIFSTWSKIEPFAAAIHFLNLANVCLKLDGKYCVLHQQTLDNRAAAFNADVVWGRM
jgi:hypothetical protein